MGKAKLLVVDDQQAYINFFREQFGDCEINEANSGRTALKLIQEEKPDIIFLDAMIPGIDGYTVLSIVKNSPETRFIPVVLTAAAAGDEDRVKALEKGADGFFIKPFNSEILHSKVQDLLQIKALYDELWKVQQRLISLARITEDKYDYLAGHSRRTAEYAVRLARKDLLQPFWQEKIKMAALLHSIGNIGIKESIFLKPDQLSVEEYEAIRSHPVASATICSMLTVLKPLLPFLRHHHERYDGRGYPDGLKGNDIPVGARILAIAETYDALTNDRPHRRAYSPEGAVTILRENAGTQWDPHLVELFCQMVENGTLNAD